MSPSETSILLGAAAGAANIAGGLLLIRRRPSDVALQLLISFGAGFLVAAVSLELLPQALASAPLHGGLLILLGYVLVYLLERTVLPHAHLAADMPEHRPISSRTGFSVLFGLAVHTFFDGVVISSGFVLSTWLGWILFVAILLHKIPEGLTAASFMLSARRGSMAALIATILLAVMTVLGTLLIGLFPRLVSFGLPLAAGVTLYVAASGLVPEVNRHPGFPTTISFVSGIALFLALKTIVGV